jgi:hypothetical protein
MHHVADKLPEEAWNDLKQASDEREITDFKEVRTLWPQSVLKLTTSSRQFRSLLKPFRT